MDEFCLSSGEKIWTFSLSTLLYQQFRVNTVHESFALICKSFALIRERVSHYFAKEFRVISRKLRFYSRKLRIYLRKFRVNSRKLGVNSRKYNFFLYENEPNRLSYNLSYCTMDAINFLCQHFNLMHACTCTCNLIEFHTCCMSAVIGCMNIFVILAFKCNQIFILEKHIYSLIVYSKLHRYNLDSNCTFYAHARFR